MSDCKTSSELAEEHGCPESEFDFTIAFAVAGERRIGFFHVGDGALTFQRDGVCQTVVMPDKGNLTTRPVSCTPATRMAGNFTPS